MPAQRFDFGSWDEFKRALTAYADRSQERKRQLIFRGQSNAEWALHASLDRGRAFRSSSDRDAELALLLDDFKRLCAGLAAEAFRDRDERQLEMFARHHGVPTRLLDWTESPYYAAFFAFDPEPNPLADTVAVWMLDRAKFVEQDVPDIELIDPDPFDDEAWNRRARLQQGLYTIFKTAGALDSLMDGGLTLLTIPTTDRDTALSDLDEMGIHARSLFESFEAAGRLATRRFDWRRDR